MSGANQAYPQTVNLDTAKAKAADMQSQTSKAQGGNINPTDPASKARVRLCGAHCLAITSTACHVHGLRYDLALGRYNLVRGSQHSCQHRVSHRQPTDGVSGLRGHCTCKRLRDQIDTLRSALMCYLRCAERGVAVSACREHPDFWRSCQCW